MEQLKRYIEIPTTYKIEDLSGNKYNYLTVIDFSEKVGNRLFWNCKCVCGNTKKVRTDALKDGSVKSCGCLVNGSKRQDFEKKGILPVLTDLSSPRTREFQIWVGIKQRCLNPKCTAFKSYGGRGITICNRWKDSYNSFMRDIGPRPSIAHTVERIDNNGPYSPENCKWATRKEQARNTRTNNFITYQGRKLLLIEFCEMMNISISLFKHYFKKGDSIENIAKRAKSRNIKSASLIPHVFSFIN